MNTDWLNLLLNSMGENLGSFDLIYIITSLVLNGFHKNSFNFTLKSVIKFGIVVEKSNLNLVINYLLYLHIFFYIFLCICIIFYLFCISNFVFSFYLYGFQFLHWSHYYIRKTYFRIDDLMIERLIIFHLLLLILIMKLMWI